MAKSPLISIITVNLNNLEGLKKTMQSVFEQAWKEFEYIIIDGGSTDGSKEYIESNSDEIDHWVSEPDTGIYNAMNKGIKAAKGEYLLFLNSGDWLYDSDVLRKIISQFSEDYSIYYGNVQRVYPNNDLVVKTYPKNLSFSFFMDSALGHQSVFIKRSLFKELGAYNEEYKILADWEFLILAICKYNIKAKFLEMLVSTYPMDGISSSIEGKKIMKKERSKCYSEHFPLFMEDYRIVNRQRELLNRPSARLFQKIDKNSKTSKLNHTFLRILNKVFRNG